MLDSSRSYIQLSHLFPFPMILSSKTLHREGILAGLRPCFERLAGLNLYQHVTLRIIAHDLPMVFIIQSPMSFIRNRAYRQRLVIDEGVEYELSNVLEFFCKHTMIQYMLSC